MATRRARPDGEGAQPELSKNRTKFICPLSGWMLAPKIKLTREGGFLASSSPEHSTDVIAGSAGGQKRPGNRLNTALTPPR